MTTKPANRFGFTLDLRVDDDHVYSVASPPIDVGRHIVEMTEALTRVEGLLSTDSKLPAEERKGDDAVPDELKAMLQDLHDRTPDAIRKDQLRAYLGDAYDRMVEDGMPFEVVKLAAGTVAVWVQTNRETAEEYWNNGGRRPNPRRVPADRRTKRS